jgi:sugar phosphate isomerase/epimerase
MLYTRRDLGKLALAAPLAGALGAAKINSTFNGVRIGAITYSFNSIASPDVEAIIRAYVEIGLGEAELMSNHCESLAGAPSAGGRGGGGGGRGAAATPEQVALGAKGITTSTTLTMAKRIAPVADRHKLLVGYHGHDATNDPNQTATLESYDTLMAYGKYNGVNLDIGHFTAANYDAVDFIQKHHDKITNLHVKDMKRDHGTYAPFGQGDTPIKGVLQLLKKEKYGFPANIELEYRYPPESNLIAEMKKCLAYCKDCLA